MKNQHNQLQETEIIFKSLDISGNLKNLGAHKTVIGSKTYRKFTGRKWELRNTSVCALFAADRPVSGRWFVLFFGMVLST